jgi:hypothetical protein
MGSQTLGHAQERKRERGRRGVSVPLGFAKREEKKEVQIREGSCGHGHMRENKGAKKKREGSVSLFLGFSQKERKKREGYGE